MHLRWRQYCLRVLTIGITLSIFLFVSTRASTNTLRHAIISKTSQLSQHRPQILSKSTRDAADAADAAGNTTLGFDKIYLINMPTRHDRLDALSLQAYLAGLDVNVVPGVSPDMIPAVGLPPTHMPANSLTSGQRSIWRAHANIWAKVLRERTPTALIMEADACWDINIREIMSNFNTHFGQFLHQIGSEPLLGPKSRGSHHQENIKYRPRDLKDDPWRSDHWDILSIGQCSEATLYNETFITYKDSHVVPGMKYFGRELGRERIIRRAGHQGCGTAYAVSLQGASKLLLRSIADLDQAVDTSMSSLIQSGHVVSYSMYPPVMSQWLYIDGIGMDVRGANSDHTEAPGGMLSNTGSMDWSSVLRTGSVWEPRRWPTNPAFEKMALQAAWEEIFRDADPYSGFTTQYKWYGGFEMHNLTTPAQRLHNGPEINYNQHITAPVETTELDY